MKCAACRGACCETLILYVQVPNLDMARYVELHSSPVAGSPVVKERSFEARCLALEAGGRCTVYDDRPKVCRDYERGGIECLLTVKARRSKAEYGLIREAEDPPVWEVDAEVARRRNTAKLLT